MGIYVNPGSTFFREAVNSMIYIDKSGLISHTNAALNTNRKNICVSRPRRFGKSMAADMLTAYYSKGAVSGSLFSGLEIEKDPSYQKHLNQHNVIRFDVQQFLASPEDLDTFLDTIRSSVIEELKAAFPSCSGLTTEMKLPMAFNKIFNATGESFLFIVDEWDCVFRMASDRQDIQKRYLDFLRVLFKGAVYVELAYLTGILPIKKYGEHSAVNIFDEYSMTDPKSFNTYFGFTSQEVITQCQKYNMPFDQMQQWYDGYLLGNAHIYNPKSVSDALTWRKFKSYWTGTETYEALKTYIERNFDGLKEAVVEMIGGGSCPVDPTTFQNDMTTFSSRDDILTLLVHLGYLTYDEETGETSIPNQEIRQEFVRSVRTGNVWGSLMDSIVSSHAPARGATR